MDEFKDQSKAESIVLVSRFNAYGACCSGMFAIKFADARAKTLSVDNANEFVNNQRNEALDS